MSQVKTISVAQLHDLIGAKAHVRVIDVRSYTEYKEKHISFAEHFPIDKIEGGNFESVDAEILVTVCGSGGGRSENAATILAQKFNREAFYLEGGTFGWFEEADQKLHNKQTILDRFLSLGQLTEDKQTDKLKKTSLLLVSLPFALAGLVWGGLYFYNGLLLSGCIPFIYGILSLLSIVRYVIWKSFQFFRFTQILLILFLPFFLQLSLGGFMPASAVILWSFIAPMGALFFYDAKRSLYWFGAFVVVVITAFALNSFLPQYNHTIITPTFINGMFLLNVIGVSALVYSLQYYFARKQSEFKDTLEERNNEIAEKSKEITDSITYAQRIQLTLLAHDSFLKDNLKDHFVLFKPKDIVSGDFYWATKRGDNFYLAVCDSTGHGVPGAFMSLLNISFLNEAINEKGIEAPNEICEYVRKKLIENISHDGSQDGMDGVLLRVNSQTNELTFAAGYNAPFLVSGGTGKDLGADKMPIGKGEKTTDFQLHRLDMKVGDTLYLFTDGYTDQFGGPRGKKFKSKQFSDLLISFGDVALDEQKKVLSAIHTQWRGNLEQTDDILVVGIRL